jgi:hypothetical protein
MNRFFLHYWFLIWGLAVCTVRLAPQLDTAMRVRRAMYRKTLGGVFAPAGG